MRKKYSIFDNAWWGSWTLHVHIALRERVQQNSTMAPFLVLSSSRRLLKLLVVICGSQKSSTPEDLSLSAVPQGAGWPWVPLGYNSRDLHSLLHHARTPQWPRHLSPSWKVSTDSRILLSSYGCITWATRLHIHSCTDLADASASRSAPTWRV